MTMNNRPTNEVEFSMKPSKKDFAKVSITNIIHKRTFWIYEGGLIAFLTGAEIYAKANPNVEDFVATLGAIGLLMIIIPFPVFAALGKVMWTLRTPKENDIFIVNDDGCGLKCGKSISFLEWNRFKQIEEIGNYVFLRKYQGPYFVIFKHLLSDETVSEIKKILAQVPVENKKLAK